MHEIEPIAIDDPIAWVSISLSRERLFSTWRQDAADTALL